MRWLMGKRDKHIRPETLSEYLDGRLSPADASRVEGHLAACARCQDEVESLRQTVGLLHRVPQMQPSRSFVLLEAPVPARPAFRAPAWAYGAVASAFALAFAIVLSMDVGGLLVPSVSPDEQTFQIGAAGTPAPAGDEEAATLDAAPGTPAPKTFGEERAVPQAMPTPAPAANGMEAVEAMPPPPGATVRGATSWVWRLVEGLLAGAAAVAIGGYLLRHRIRTLFG